MIPLGTTLAIPQTEADYVTSIGTDLTAQYFADHKTAIKDTTPAMQKQVKKFA